MRGKENREYRFSRIQRITPAHAGKSVGVGQAGAVHRDHPRACGEKGNGAPLFCKNLGSPPRMRGKAQSRAAHTSQSRITPAHAGKRVIGAVSLFAGRDHPRACGEKGYWRCIVICGAGSPPRMRGKVTGVKDRPARYRITPAHAGKRPQCPPQLGRWGDHPRACGEKLNDKDFVDFFKGSPPRMRGKDLSPL